MTSQPCTLLEWDTKFFNRRIARVDYPYLTRPRLKAVLSWCESNQIECLYFRADADDAISIELVESNDFIRYDEPITWGQVLNSPYPIPDSNELVTFRLYQPKDLPHLRQIARFAYTHSRFFNDPCFTKEQWQSLYDTWIYRSCVEGYADAVLVADVAGEAVGFLTCLLHDSGEGQIALVGVAEKMRGRRIGKQLTDFAIHWFSQQGCTNLIVISNGSNIPAQRLFMTSGFQMQRKKIWYHKWFVDC